MVSLIWNYSLNPNYMEGYFEVKVHLLHLSLHVCCCEFQLMDEHIQYLKTLLFLWNKSDVDQGQCCEERNV